MTARRNPTYFDGDLVRCIKDEALRVIDQSGPGAVSLRAIARSAGVSHNAPTKHFPAKRDLFAALAIEGFELIDEQFRRVSACQGDADGAIERTSRSAKAFVDWARSNRAHYLVMWQPDLYDDDNKVRAARERPRERWVELVHEAHAAGLGSRLSPDALVEVLWAIVTGLGAQSVSGIAPTHHGHTGSVVDAAIQALSMPHTE